MPIYVKYIPKLKQVFTSALPRIIIQHSMAISKKVCPLIEEIYFRNERGMKLLTPKAITTIRFSFCDQIYHLISILNWCLQLLFNMSGQSMILTALVNDCW